MKKLTEKQKAFIEFIREFGRREKMAPTVYELAEKFGIKTSTVFAHLKALKKKGYLNRSSKARSISLVKKRQRVVGNASAVELHLLEIPLLGKISAGLPLDAPELREGTVAIDSSFVGGRDTDKSKLFALKINGESMRDLGIYDGDIIFVKQTPDIRTGDVVVALVDGETTVKSYYLWNDGVELRPANPAFQSQFYKGDAVTIQGKVVALQRRLMV